MTGKRSFAITMRVPVMSLALAMAAAGAARAAPPPDALQVHPEPRAVPALEFVDGAGDTRALADFRGRVVVLNVWATWCAPCREEMPTLDALQAALGGSRLEVVALSVDREGADAVRAFFDELGIGNLEIYVDTRMRAPGKLGVPGLPATLVIDPEGREVARLIGPADWNSPAMRDYLRGLLDEEAAAMQAVR